MEFPQNLQHKLDVRLNDKALRKLSGPILQVDFSSNDYLGFAQSRSILDLSHQLLFDKNILTNGATGSRLISGNHQLYSEAEELLAQFHQTESALIFNSGYDANVGFFSSVPQRSDIVLYDELCHASIRDGIRLGTAKSFKFFHNDIGHLSELIQKHKSADNIYIVTESVFSMDGDSPDLSELVQLSIKNNCYAVIDEAHALGVFGNRGIGLVQQLNLQNDVFARIMTFGKGLGCHGAAIVGSSQLTNYLINFARSFIYTTGLPPHSIATIITAYQLLRSNSDAQEQVLNNILHFSRQKNSIGLKQIFVRSKSAIQSAIIPGNEKVQGVAANLQQRGFDVKAILSPTVPEGQERLRFCLHSYNTTEEISNVLAALSNELF
jgi:8-amino-7-oxononanoate synthase